MIERYSLPQISRVWSDRNKFSIWLRIEILACEAQAKLGLIPGASLRKIRSRAKFNIKRINKVESVVKHDVIAFLTNVGEYVGPESRYIHYGMTSSDVLDTALSVQMKESGEMILVSLGSLLKVLYSKARRYKHLTMVGRTHGVHAEAITLGLKFALWYDETRRNISRLEKAVQAISVGKISGAVGTYEHIDPFVERYVCSKLRLRPAKISTQIIQRDAHAEFMSVLAIVGSSLEKFATEVRHLQRTEVLELEEPFTKGQKGSSAMPHKKNPVVCERIAGLARILRGNTMAAMENINLWHERDISHSSVERMIIPDSTMILYYMTEKMKEVLQGLVVNRENISRNLNITRGLIHSQKALLKLVGKGMKREEAYKLVQKYSMRSWKENIELKDLFTSDKRLLQLLGRKGISQIFDQKEAGKNVDYIFRKVGIR